MKKASQKLRTSLLLLAPLLFACGTAQALGLGQIQVKSKPGQPLVAEIPVVYSSPDELIGLQAHLADVETFKRVGLQTPEGLVSDLNFSIVLNENGETVIRVTSNTPVDQPAVNFLMEVNWDQGRIVREFAALVDVPKTLDGGLTPPIEDAQGAPSNLVSRPDVELANTDSAGSEEKTVEDPFSVGKSFVATTEADKPVPAPPAAIKPRVEQAPDPDPRKTEAPKLIATKAEAKENLDVNAATTVKKGQTLSGIAKDLSANSGRTLNETMIALLRANPRAFINGNINLVRAGAVLKAPTQAQWSSKDVAQANLLVQQQVAQWRQWQTPEKKEIITGELVVNAAMAAEAKSKLDVGKKGLSVVAKPENNSARLEIVPAVGDNKATDANSGRTVNGQGEQVNLAEQTDINKNESKIVKDLEAEELKSRIAELDGIKADQERLLALKENALAQTQKALKTQLDKNEAAKKAKAAKQQPQNSPVVWGISAIILLVLGGIGAWGRRISEQRRKKKLGFLEVDEDAGIGEQKIIEDESAFTITQADNSNMSDLHITNAESDTNNTQP